jgi:hypothetical protein
VLFLEYNLFIFHAALKYNLSEKSLAD